MAPMIAVEFARRARDLAKLGIKALVAGSLANLMSAALACLMLSL